jgi:hypothetical protein
MAALQARMERKPHPLQCVSHAVAPVRLRRADLDRDAVEEGERGDLDPGDDRCHTGGGSMPDGHEDDGEQHCGDAREVLRLGERLEYSGQGVGAEIVEDGEVEDLESQQRGGQAE